MCVFRPMMTVVARRLLGEVSWGLKLRVCMGAGLSVLDMATDIFVVVGYMGKEETRGYGYSLLGMLAGCMALQLLFVFVQNSKKPSAVAKEMLIVLSMLKPGFDAARVASGKKMEEHHSMDAKTELVATKGIELVCESIPGCVLQLYAILKTKDYSNRTAGSVMVSALTAGFSSASVSFDYDVDPLARKHTPDFYGYVPDGGSRTLIFACMLLNSSLLLAVRSFSAAIIMQKKKRYFMIYMAGDQVLYLLQKIARGDFHYWMPVDGAIGLFVSLLMRVMVKTVTDFTGLVQFRHAYELGGVYWTANMLLALATSFVFLWVFYDGDNKEAVWTLMLGASGTWLVTFAVFLLLMKPQYRSTFFSWKTGKELAMDIFTKGETDEDKHHILECNMKQWKKVRGDVREWVEGGWWRWREEKPEWFSEAWIARLPLKWIPAEERSEVESARGGASGGRGFRGTNGRAKYAVAVGATVAPGGSK